MYDPELKVFEALNNAVDGYADFLFLSTVEEIVLDLMSFCSELENCEEVDLTPYVQKWLNTRNELALCKGWDLG